MLGFMIGAGIPCASMQGYQSPTTQTITQLVMTANAKVRPKNESIFEPAKQVTSTTLDVNAQDNNSSSDSPPDGDAQTTSIYTGVTRVAWDWVCWSGTKTFDGMDFAGEVLANFLGLNQSKYQWIIDAEERDEEEKQQRRLEKRQRRQLRLEQLLEAEQRKLEELENGMLAEDSTV